MRILGSTQSVLRHNVCSSAIHALARLPRYLIKYARTERDLSDIKLLLSTFTNRN